MILIVTNRDDLTADWLILELIERHVSFFRFNTEDYIAQTSVTWSPPHPPLFVVAGTPLDFAGIKAVWYRRPVSPSLPEDLSPDRARWVEGEARELLEGAWCARGDALWVNHPHRNAAASSKPNQLALAASLGMRVPTTLITNDRGAAREFVARQPQGAICKPLRSGRIPIRGEEKLFFTSVVTRADLEFIDTVGPEPYIFQELIEKQYDVRVTVIGNEAHSVRIRSQAIDSSRVDWRRADTAELVHEVDDLPPDVQRQTLAMTNEYGLEFGAIDYAVDQEGDYVFLELNPNGQWAWVEQLTGLPLRARLADLLEAGAKA